MAKANSLFILIILVTTMIIGCTPKSIQVNGEPTPKPSRALIEDPVAEFVKFNDPSEIPRDKILRIKSDFNEDGIQDFGITMESYVGNKVGPWWIFYGQSGGKFHVSAGPVSFPTGKYTHEYCHLDEFKKENKCRWANDL